MFTLSGCDLFQTTETGLSLSLYSVPSLSCAHSQLVSVQPSMASVSSPLLPHWAFPHPRAMAGLPEATQSVNDPRSSRQQYSLAYDTFYLRYGLRLPSESYRLLTWDFCPLLTTGIRNQLDLRLLRAVGLC